MTSLARPAGLPDLPRTALLAAIRFYKRHVSPRKGFGCAYRVHTGRCSCSTLGYRAVSRYGVFRGLGLLRLRLDRCHEVFVRHHGRTLGARRGQVGDCDPGCDCGDASACDLGGCDLHPCDPAGHHDCSVCDCGCGDCGDWDPGSRRKRRRERDGAPPPPVDASLFGGDARARDKP